MHEFEWYQSDLFEIDRKNFEKDKKKMVEKYLWKSSIFRNVVGCNNCSKVSMHGKANSSKMFADTFRNMHFFCDAIELKKSVEGTLKV